MKSNRVQSTADYRITTTLISKLLLGSDVLVTINGMQAQAALTTVQ